MKHKLSLFIWAALLVSILAMYLGVPDALAAQKLKFGTPLKEKEHPLSSLPVIVAEEKGFFKQNGLEVEWVAFAGGGPMMQALSAGAVTVALNAPQSQIVATSRGAPVVIVADTQGQQPFYIWVRPGSKVKGTKDLKGTAFGINRFGGLAEAYSRVVTKALGLEWQRDIKIIAAGGVKELAAVIKAGHVEGAIMDVYTMAPLKFAGELQELVAVGDYLPKKWSEQVVVANKDFAKKEPQIVRAAVRSIVQADNYIENNSAWTVEKLKSFYGYSDPMARWIYGFLTFSKDGKTDRETIENIRNFLVDYGLIPRADAAPVEQLYVKELWG